MATTARVQLEHVDTTSSVLVWRSQVTGFTSDLVLQVLLFLKCQDCAVYRMLNTSLNKVLL